MAIFEKKNFNDQVYGEYLGNKIPQLKMDALFKSGAVVNDTTLYDIFGKQTGGWYATFPMKDNLKGKAQKYDGKTDAVPYTRDTFEQGVSVIGKMYACLENDFASILAGNTSFLPVMEELTAYWDAEKNNTLLSQLKGIFNMTNALDKPFVDGHTIDISKETGDASKFTATTLNTAIQKACGDNKGSFSLVIMHSAVATQVENLNLEGFTRYTDASGIEKTMTIFNLNGKVVITSDDMPIDAQGNYTSYVLGNGAFRYADCSKGLKKAGIDEYEAKNGGENVLVTRERYAFIPIGISFTKKAVATFSPADQEYEIGDNWEVARNSDNTATFSPKAIPIARIISKV